MRLIVRIWKFLHTAFCILTNWLIFRFKGVRCAASLSDIKGIVKVSGRGTIVIGVGTRVNSGPRMNPIGGDTVLNLSCRNGGRIIIGSNCGLSNCAIVSDSSVTLDSNVKIGGGVKIYDTDFHSLDPVSRENEIPGHIYGSSKSVFIGRNVFIGAHSIILKGTTIGENSVIGAGSVVTKSVPPNQVWAGNPARMIRSI